jgi:uncharacterized membrane protein YfcA
MKIRQRSDAVEADQSAVGLPPSELKWLDSDWGQACKTLLLLMAVIGAGVLLLNSLWAGSTVTTALNQALASPQLWGFVAVGLAAQAIDGSLGMAYGVTANSLLMAQGVPPAAATTAVHLSEVFTTGFSGAAHYRLGNFNRKLFLSLLIPGTVGALSGAWVVSQVDGKLLKPWVSGYLLLMGLYILYKAYRAYRHRQAVQARAATAGQIAPLAVLGGFVDSVGGGGWGPVVTTTLLGRGHAPRETIGSVNAAEFFLTLASGAAFALLVGFGYWTAIVGLVLGGMLAAPFAALLTHRLQPRQLLVMVGLLISGLSLYNLLRALG